MLYTKYCDKRSSYKSLDSLIHFFLNYRYNFKVCHNISLHKSRGQLQEILLKMYMYEILMFSSCFIIYLSQ